MSHTKMWETVNYKLFLEKFENSKAQIKTKNNIVFEKNLV